MTTTKRSRCAARDAPMLNLAEGAGEEVDTLREEIQEWYDNLPESFQSGDKGSDLETCASALETLKEEIDALVRWIEDLPKPLQTFDINYTQDERRSARSRAGRLGNVESQIGAIHTEVSDLIDLPEHAEHKAALEDVQEAAESAQALFGDVSFPGMY